MIDDTAGKAVVTATFLGKVNPESRGDQRLYRVHPPLEGHDYVVVSAVGDDARPLELAENSILVLAGLAGHLLGKELDYGNRGVETFIFPSDNTGEVVDWGELPGSFQGRADHAEALRRAGYVEEGTL